MGTLDGSTTVYCTLGEGCAAAIGAAICGAGFGADVAGMLSDVAAGIWAGLILRGSEEGIGAFGRIRYGEFERKCG